MTGQNRVPPVAHSFYVRSANLMTYESDGKAVGRYDAAHCTAGSGPNRGAAKMAILAFGQPRRYAQSGVYEGYGTFTTNMQRLTGGQIVSVTESFVDGYMAGLNGSGCPALRLLLGTSNSQICGSSAEDEQHYDPGCTRPDAGQAWAEIGNSVYDYVVNVKHWQNQILVGAADDIETGSGQYHSGNYVYDSYSATVDFLDAFDAYDSNNLLMFDFGEAVPTADRWSVGDIYQVAYGRRHDYPIPEIYLPTQTCRWTGYTTFRGVSCGPSSVAGYARDNGVPIFFPGEITQCITTTAATTGDVPSG